MTLGMVLCAMAGPGSLLAWRYATSFVLQWIVQGTVLAALIPAAGPCFFARFQIDVDRFEGLHRALEAQSRLLVARGAPGLQSLVIQDHLLRLYDRGTIMVGGGIAAMPSLHNALAMLFACAAFRLNRALGWLFSGYAAVIWIGSVHLGWHYAVDGIVALIATVMIWRATGWLAVRCERRPARGDARSPLPA